MSKKKKRIMIVGGIILILLGYLVYSAMGSNTLFNKTVTVSELVSDSSLRGEYVRVVGGKVVKGSLKTTRPYRFKVAQGGSELQIVYSGSLPASFRDETDVIAEGQYQRNGELKAKTILTKCPSKYEAKTKKENQ